MLQKSQIISGSFVIISGSFVKMTCNLYTLHQILELSKRLLGTSRYTDTQTDTQTDKTDTQTRTRARTHAPTQAHTHTTSGIAAFGTTCKKEFFKDVYICGNWSTLFMTPQRCSDVVSKKLQFLRCPKMIGLFCRISSLSQGSFAKETCDWNPHFLTPQQCSDVVSKKLQFFRRRKALIPSQSASKHQKMVRLFWHYGVATISRLLKIIGLSCKRAP